MSWIGAGRNWEFDEWELGRWGLGSDGTKKKKHDTKAWHSRHGTSMEEERRGAQGRAT